MNAEQEQCLKEPKNKTTESMLKDPLAIPVIGETASLTFQNMPSVMTVYLPEELMTKWKTSTKLASSFRLEHEVEALSARSSRRKEEVEKKSNESQIAKLILPKNQDNGLTCCDVTSKERPNHLQASEIISDLPSQSGNICQKDEVCSCHLNCEDSNIYNDKRNMILNKEYSNSGSEPTNSQGNRYSDHQPKKHLNNERNKHLDIEQQQCINDPKNKTTETTIKDLFLTSMIGKSDSLKSQQSVTVHLPEEPTAKWKNSMQSASLLKVQQEVEKKSRESQITKPLLSNNHDDNSQRQNQLQENEVLSDPPSESSHLCHNDEIQELHIGHDLNCSESELYNNKSSETLNNEHSNSSGNKSENSHKNKHSNHLHKKLLNSERNRHSENTYSDSPNDESHKQSKSSSHKRLNSDYMKCLSSRSSKHLNKSSNEGLNSDHDKCSNSRNNKRLKSGGNKHLNRSSNVSLNSDRNKFSNSRSHKHLKVGAKKHSNRSSNEGSNSKNNKQLKSSDNEHLNRSSDESLNGGHNTCSNSRNNKRLKSDVNEHLNRSSSKGLNSDHNKCSDNKNKRLKSGGNKHSNRSIIETLNSDHNKCSNSKNNKRLKSGVNKYLNRSSNEGLSNDHNNCSNSRNSKRLKSGGNKHSNKGNNVRLNSDPNKFSNKSSKHLKVGANEHSNRSSNENLSNNRDSDSDCNEHFSGSDSDFSTTNIMNQTITPSRKRKAKPMDQKQKTDEKSKASTATVQNKRKAQLEKQTNKEWSLSEQLAFIKAVKLYGTSNPKKLAEAIKTCNVDQVKYFITTQAQKLRMNWRVAIIKKVTSETSSNFQTGKPVKPDLSSAYAVPKLLQYPALHLWRKMAVFHYEKAYSSREVMVELFKNFREQAADFNGPNIPKFKAMYKYFEDLLNGHVPQPLGPLETHLICQLRDEMFRRCSSMEKEKEMMKNYNGCFRFISTSSVKGSHPLYYSKGLIPLEDDMFKNLRTHILTYNTLNPLRLPVGEEKTYTEKIAMVHKGRRKMIAVLRQKKMGNAAKLQQMKKRKAAELRQKMKEKARKLQQKNTVTARKKLQQSNKNISKLHRKDKLKPVKPAQKKKKDLCEKIIESYLTCNQQGKRKLRYQTVI